MPQDINWDQIINNAAQKTDQQFSSEISSLSRLNDQEINSIVNDSGISQKDLANVIKALTDATLSNQNKANAIANITGGVKALVGIAEKFI